MHKILVTLLLLALMLIASCGSGNNAAEEEINEETEIVNIQASNWEFDQEAYTVSAGEIAVHLSNEEGYHGIEVEGTDISIDGDGSMITTLEAGEYVIRCSIPCGEGHNDMTATLIVQ
ncbi:cupredoxin domain-containing protein [Gracilibacillus alcaliphilus]|uniref:cytochrome C oxidase subunit II n=1 Tax=Gracilibacillus alcaliphilus TaxID=1401441 RepID=UPI00195850CD|nr:cytochrome C oxidase subunit II [Gracilibacillus alcaliphilus]MBM7675295.1 heme/copper-type cytochrome/quinol oxidase subunit 2 [Gracilibacillus alcaliphilus]